MGERRKLKSRKKAGSCKRALRGQAELWQWGAALGGCGGSELGCRALGFTLGTSASATDPAGTSALGEKAVKEKCFLMA